MILSAHCGEDLVERAEEYPEENGRMLTIRENEVPIKEHQGALASAETEEA